MKRTYLKMFFEKFEVSKGKIVKYHLSKEVKELIENGSVRVRKTGLAEWNRFRTFSVICLFN